MLSWSELESGCLNCTKCALYETRTNVVFGVGNKNAEVLFVGEGPGEQEDLKGEPFVGRGGHLLDDMLKIIGLDRTKNIYIANMVKCRPPKNRDPLNTTRDHGKWFEKDGVKFMALYHPAALLRDPHRRPDTFVDLKELEREIRATCPGTYTLS